MKWFAILLFVKVTLIDAVTQDICEQCIPKEQCQAFAGLGVHEQESWMKQFPCDGPTNNNTVPIFGFATVAKGDKVCCPSSLVWGVNILDHNLKNTKKNSTSSNGPAIEPEYQGINGQPNRRNPFFYGNQNTPVNQNAFGNQQFNPSGYGGQNYPNQNMYGSLNNPQNLPANQNIFGGQNNMPNGRGGINQNLPLGHGGYGNNPNFPGNQGYLGNSHNQPGDQSIYGGQQTRPANQGYPNNQNIYGGQQNIPANQGYPNNQNIYGDQQTIPANQGFPGNQNIYGGQQNRPTQGYLGNDQNIPGSQNTYPGQQYVPGQNDINSGQRPSDTNVYGHVPNQNIGGQLNRPVNQNILNNPQIFNRPSTGSNAITRPWGNENIPGYQNIPQGNIPDQVQPGVFNPSTPSTTYQNPYYQSNTPPQNQNNYENSAGDDDSKILSQQCRRMKTSYPPNPGTGCCGKDMSDAVRVTDLQNLLSMFAPVKSQNTWNQGRYPQGNNRNWPSQGWPNYQRRKRSLKNVTTDITLDDRIAGGRETELDQFPWTVLLKTTFDYGEKKAAFSCGGSLISRRYVLTAGHCVYEPKARISDVEVTLAEYDKRTFPIDCITVFGGGRECVQNIVLHAEDVVHHPEYDDDRLLNDIALIRLNAFAPYTRYIRPVCLPAINIDIPEFSTLPLAVAGWGRDGQYVTEVKQSTVVQLVPPDDCEKSYPHLTKSHLCAAGRTGEDTCKGDSGGPLMMLFKGSYYVIGIVSGKRADTPCGSKVPSLYTNVYQFVDWIQNTIRE